MKIGVLALQGAFAEHLAILRRLHVEALAVRLPGHLAGLNGLIIPGGESTTISRLMKTYRLDEAIKDSARNGMAILGTCAGMILLAKELSESDPIPLGLMDIKVRRNAYGRQVDSFEGKVAIPALGEKPFPLVFIRAPVIESINGKVEIMAELDGRPIAVKQQNIMACAFHPELTTDLRFHQYFVNIASNGN